MSHTDASEWFYVDPTSPSGLKWRKDRRAGKGIGRLIAKAGDIAGSRSRSGHWRVSLNSKLYTTSRVVRLLIDGTLSVDCVVDHIDGDTGNNENSNLRVVTAKVNSRNQKFRSNNKSGVKGVHFQLAKGSHGYFVATCMSLDGSLKKWHYSVTKLGREEAFRLACLKREEEISKLNLYGAGYTERHRQNDFD